MERTDKQKEQLLQDLWYKRNPCHDNDQEGNYRFWGTVLCVFSDYQKALNIPLVTNRFLAIAHYPNMEHKVNDVIQLPNDNWKHADGTFCDADYFRDYPDYFKEI